MILYMPRKTRKRIFKKKRIVKNTLKRQIKRLFGNKVMINPSPYKLHMPVPLAYFTTFRCQWDCALAAGASASSNIIFLQANNPFTPFSTISSSIGTNFQIGIDESGAVTTKNPASLSQLLNASGLYNVYHVVRCKLKVTAMVAGVGDQIIIGMAPTTASGTVYGTMGSLEQGPKSVIKYVNAYNSTSQDSISLDLNLPSMFGLTLAEYLADPTKGGSVTAGPTGFNLQEIQVRYATQDRVVTQFTIGWKFNVEYDVYLEQVVTGGLSDI